MSTYLRQDHRADIPDVLGILMDCPRTLALIQEEGQMWSLAGARGLVRLPAAAGSSEQPP
ncbi:hypothetical protein EJB05_57292, partial [Eragrostis curvula]